MERSSLGNLHVFFGRCVSIHTYCSVNGGWSSQRCRWRRPTTGCVFSPLIEEHVGGFGLQKRAKSALVKDDDKSFSGIGWLHYHNSSLAHWSYTGVIEMVPTAIVFVLGVSGVCIEKKLPLRIKLPIEKGKWRKLNLQWPPPIPP